MAVTTHPLTGVFDADRMHSSFQFGVRHTKVSTFRPWFPSQATSPRIAADPFGSCECAQLLPLSGR